MDSLLFCNPESDVYLVAPPVVSHGRSTQRLLDAVPHVTFLQHLDLVCFDDVILDVILSLILYRFLLKFLLLLRCKLGADVLPTAIVFCSATATVVA